MKHIKKIALIQIAILIINCMSMTAFAATLTSGDVEVPYIVEGKNVSERIADIYVSDEYTYLQKQRALEKLKAKLHETNSAQLASVNSSNYSYTLNVPYQCQAEDYFCGPATTRQTLLFYKVSNVPSQYDIADDLNVTASLGVPDAGYMIDYINSYIPDEAPYSEEHPENIDDMILSFKVACKSYGPPILRIKANTSSDWPYTTGGHFLNVSGAYKNGSEYTFELTDPYIEWATINNSGKYEATAEEVYDVVTLHWFGGYWW